MHISKSSHNVVHVLTTSSLIIVSRKDILFEEKNTNHTHIEAFRDTIHIFNRYILFEEKYNPLHVLGAVENNACIHRIE